MTAPESSATRGLGWAGGFLIVTHALVHLVIWPGAPLGTPDGARLRWNGGSWSWEPSWLPPTAVIVTGGTLLAGAVLGCLLGGLALLGLPGARRFPLLANGTGAVCSLSLFALAWPGLEPDPSEFVVGPVLSAVLLAAVGGALLRRGWRRRLRARTGPDAPTGSGIAGIPAVGSNSGSRIVRPGTGPRARG
ncbi:hypothetical protein UG55_101634 [Frankia sp. EI5c]|uniref:hypothetical protein n=1 Tax=Frankia sp. EI5c TaxID=683316 RepID=UPI0007C367E2|nr:hypothetical protein [Frankia sp. EI5c]OAA26370.1 hypothetical protein UG55_101634 [Frankia sp. EI5c]